MDNFLSSSGYLNLLRELQNRDVRYMMGDAAAAALQGAGLATADIDLWIRDLADPRFHEAVEAAGGMYIPPMGMMPPRLGRQTMQPFDLVLSLSGLGRFDEEYKRVVWVEIDKIRIPMLPLDRILASKRAADRPKDRVAIPILEDLIRTLEARRAKPEP